MQKPSLPGLCLAAGVVIAALAALFLLDFGSPAPGGYVAPPASSAILDVQAGRSGIAGASGRYAPARRDQTARGGVRAARVNLSQRSNRPRTGTRSARRVARRPGSARAGPSGATRRSGAGGRRDGGRRGPGRQGLSRRGTGTTPVSAPARVVAPAPTGGTGTRTARGGAPQPVARQRGPGANGGPSKPPKPPKAAKPPKPPKPAKPPKPPEPGKAPKAAPAPAPPPAAVPAPPPPGHQPPAGGPVGPGQGNGHGHGPASGHGNGQGNGNGPGGPGPKHGG